MRKEWLVRLGVDGVGGVLVIGEHERGEGRWAEEREEWEYGDGVEEI